MRQRLLDLEIPLEDLGRLEDVRRRVIAGRRERDALSFERGLDLRQSLAALESALERVDGWMAAASELLLSAANPLRRTSREGENLCGELPNTLETTLACEQFANSPTPPRITGFSPSGSSEWRPGEAEARLRNGGFVIGYAVGRLAVMDLVIGDIRSALVARRCRTACSGARSNHPCRMDSCCAPTRSP